MCPGMVNGLASCGFFSHDVPHHSQHILHTIILTPKDDVTSSTHIRGSWVGLSEDLTESAKTLQDYYQTEKRSPSIC